MLKPTSPATSSIRNGLLKLSFSQSIGTRLDDLRRRAALHSSAYEIHELLGRVDYDLRPKGGEQLNLNPAVEPRHERQLAADEGKSALGHRTRW